MVIRPFPLALLLALTACASWPTRAVRNLQRQMTTKRRALPALGLAFAIVAITVAIPATAEQSNGSAVAEDAAFLIGYTFGEIAYLQRCEQELPEWADRFRMKIAEVQKANALILLMARRKVLAIADLKQGKQYRDKTAVELDSVPVAARAAVNGEIASSTNPKQFCENIAAQPSLVLANKFAAKVTNVMQFQVGYKWSPPGCEYTLLFPVPPEIDFITVDGASNFRAKVPEKESVPGNLSASCWECRLSQIQTASILKMRGMELGEYGVTNIQWSDSFTPLGYKLVAIGIKQVSGLSFAYRKVYLIGAHSVLEIQGVELSSEHPSAQLIEFEDTIAKHE